MNDGDEVHGHHDQLESAYAAFCDAWLDGQRLDVDTFCRDHPECRATLQLRIEEFIAMDACLESGDGLPLSVPLGAHPAEEEVAGETLGDFRIIREIGRGGMGVVYEAHQESLDRRVALKVLPAHLTLRKATVARFQREASTAARLEHPGIVDIYAVGEEGGNHFFAMEFVDGAPLSRVIERLCFESASSLNGFHLGAAVAETLQKGKARCATRDDSRGDLSDDLQEEDLLLHDFWNRTYIEAVCRIIARVARALDYAHDRGVIHRDVKPSNILVRENGSVVLTDFGLAREEGLPSLTVTGELSGTPHYIAPEQASPKRAPLDHRVDVYSLGVTLYEMLTLIRPFDGKTSQEVLGKIVAREPASPRSQNTLIPRDLETVCLTAMDKDPARRYQSADEFRQDLLNFVEYRPILARPTGIGTRALRLIRRHPGYSALISLLLLFIIVGPIVYAVQAKRAQLRIQAALDEKEVALSEKHDALIAKDAALVEKNAALLRAEEEAAVARSVSSYLESIFSDFYDCHAKGEDITAYELIQRNVEAVESKLADQPRLQAELLRSVALVQGILGNTAESERLLNKSLSAFRRMEGGDTAETLHGTIHVGELLLRSYRYDEAEELLVDCLEKSRAMLGDEHEDTLRVMHLLGNIWSSQGRYTEAEPLYLQLFEHYNALGDNHPEALHFMMHVGETCEALGRANEAELHLAECAERCGRALDHDHPFAMRTLHSIGISFRQKGKLADAESCFGQLLEHYRKLGDDHPETIHYMMHMGQIYIDSQQLDLAEPILLDCVERCRRILGNDHPDTENTIQSLATLYTMLGRIAQADPFSLELIDRNEKRLEEACVNFGENHVQTQYLKYQLANRYVGMSRLDEAEGLFDDLVTHSEENSRLRRALVTLEGSILRARGFYDEAEPCFLLNLDFQRQETSHHPLAISVAAFQLAEVYRHMGRAEDAIAHYMQTVEGFRRYGDDDHPTLLNCITLVAALYKSQGAYTEAERFAREALEKTPPENPNYWYRKTLLNTIEIALE